MALTLWAINKGSYEDVLVSKALAFEADFLGYVRTQHADLVGELFHEVVRHRLRPDRTSQEQARDQRNQFQLRGGLRGFALGGRENVLAEIAVPGTARGGAAS